LWFGLCTRECVSIAESSAEARVCVVGLILASLGSTMWFSPEGSYGGYWATGALCVEWVDMWLLYRCPCSWWVVCCVAWLTLFMSGGGVRDRFRSWLLE
jgi:hypothetical protein